ncbi:MAG: cytochrome C oxidase subunit IV family protein [Bacteroidota bacterium]|nr:cytochrome C oxidase subunit IV family protein [Bacteroidota bacterium]MDX5404710.1 cytochrome C oxidase subunit IV family protein [Bacteroidota bacterium]MDX5428932.1 cytochrome C oxidase subunit IV family protein [Bacteroidota bacterium]MDX5447997.1 cytochrome C oxidase subunit IV family protein [Bacteroidota bacterium]MDX5506612.1 cytochrome C oxidase subunit IV family protein [Bacteroidota bacterium]
MAHDTHHEGTRRIWIVFFILLIVTTVEVALGIIKPEILLTPFLGTHILNVIFIVLTLVKAYYIVSVFMHLGDERKGFQWTVYLPILILIPYLTFILITEGSYMFKMLP